MAYQAMHGYISAITAFVLIGFTQLVLSNSFAPDYVKKHGMLVGSHFFFNAPCTFLTRVVLMLLFSSYYMASFGRFVDAQ